MGGWGRGTSKITEPGPSVHTPKITQIIIVKYNPDPSYSPGKRSEDGFMLLLNPHLSDLKPALSVEKIFDHDVIETGAWYESRQGG